jgi:mRNA interferase MazF
VRRGDVVIVSAAGDYGKPRPAVVIQSDALASTDSILVALITSTIKDTPLHRLTLEPSSNNGLKVRSQIMADKIVAHPREKCGGVIGHVNRGSLAALDQILLFTFGLAV